MSKYDRSDVKHLALLRELARDAWPDKSGKLMATKRDHILVEGDGYAKLHIEDSDDRAYEAAEAALRVLADRPVPPPERLNLGRLIDLLARRKQDGYVTFDFCRFEPRGIASYRGYYEQLAIGHAPPGSTGQSPTVGDLLIELRAAVGKVFHGYKGGDYLMTRDTPVWVANWGEAFCATGIVGVEEHDENTVIVTGWVD